MKILIVKRNHRTYTCPNTITYIYTHRTNNKINTQKTKELENYGSQDITMPRHRPIQLCAHFHFLIHSDHSLSTLQTGRRYVHKTSMHIHVAIINKIKYMCAINCFYQCWCYHYMCTVRSLRGPYVANKLMTKE